MFLESYCHNKNNKISFTRQQASDFAKKIADDFNPLHDIDAKRFCVPGDLLFAIILERAGLSQNMTFKFSGMVNDNIFLNFPKSVEEKAHITDDNGKEYLSVEVSGKTTDSAETINALIKAYVEFSGHTFPHILVDLMAKEKVMINPARPMIMYESMSIHLESLAFKAVTLELANTTLSIDGKRGVADLIFNLVADSKVIGHGKKHMILSGLRPYEQETINEIVEIYNTKKADFYAKA
ncbi:DUF3581 domain-containing protein [Thalassotalea piscium]|uniref:DUF3581 family protein n=1 Tax=Thalassotalea piscium TaxID=1230533 RepID=A0A7X0NI68_9GAMM|nr:DUF3581 domain-containing protein [Thalassotalea piscium]MBB6543859.1 hypothetical protein [Thalassotalea piscium]